VDTSAITVRASQPRVELFHVRNSNLCPQG
jgi:hypothetical protein